MNNWKQIYKLTVVAMLLLCSIPVLAQTDSTQTAAVRVTSEPLHIKSVFIPNYLQTYKETNLWFHTTNAAGLNNQSDYRLNYTEISAGYKYTKGDHRMRQDGKTKSGIRFDAEGAKPLFGGYVWGKFSIETESKRDAQYNASIIDPLRGNPYIIADERAAKWNIQYYNLATKVSSRKMWDKVYLGAGIDYKVSTGAKQLDPRPKNYFYELELTPSIAWTVNDNNMIGGTFYFADRRETSDIDVKSGESQPVYLLEGLGAFSKTSTVAGANREYDGNTTGGELQYSWKKDATELVVSGGYRYSYEDVIDGQKKKENIAMTNTDLYTAKAELVTKGGYLTHKISAGMMLDEISGIFYDKKKDPNDPTENIILYKKTRSTYKHDNLYLSYDLYHSIWMKTWSAGAEFKYYNQEDEYKLPQPGVAASTQNIRRYDMGVRGSYSIPFDQWNSKKSTYLLLRGSVVYSKAGDCNLYYGGAEEKSVIVTGLLREDYKYLSANYWKLGGEATFAFTMTVSGSEMRAFVKTNAYYTPKVNDRQRGEAMVSVGFVM